MNAPINTGNPAFPLAMLEAAKLAATCEDLANPRLDGAERVYQETLAQALSGTSLRDYFAAKAMQGMLAVPDDQRYGDRADKTLTVEQWQQWCVTGVVEHAYRVADAMLKARLA